jgi:hypothetical protein
MKESMENIIDLVGIQSPIPNFDHDDKGISYELLLRFNIAREKRRIEGSEREAALLIRMRPKQLAFYFAGTARNQTSNPNRISVPTSENNVCNG